MEPFDVLLAILLVGGAYVMGGIPWGVVVAKVTGGPDPRTIGSGRTGGANTMRALGPRLALVAGLLDMLKGTFAVLIPLWLGAGVEVQVLCALAAVIGHSRSVFLRFGGGRGVAPGFGAFLAFTPLLALLVIPLFIGIIAITRYSSLGSLIGSLVSGILLAAATAIVPMSPWLYVYAVGGTALVWWFHRDNIGRLMNGTERKIGAPRPEE